MTMYKKFFIRKRFLFMDDVKCVSNRSPFKNFFEFFRLRNLVSEIVIFRFIWRSSGL